MNLSRARAMPMPMVNTAMMPSLRKTRARARATSIPHSTMMTKPKTKLHPAMPTAAMMPSLFKTRARARATSISHSTMMTKMKLHHAMAKATSISCSRMMTKTELHHAMANTATKANLYHRTTMAPVNVATMLSLLKTSTTAEVVAMPSLPRTSAKARTRRMLILEITLLSVAVDNMRKVSFFCQFRTQHNTN